jgi:radical SAM protein with 4Fe4S-binding SPASM domain
MNCIACWTYSPLLKKKRPVQAWFKHELSYETIEKLIQDLKRLGTEEVRLTGGGEPFMHLKILEIISLIKKNKLKLDITTNFLLLSKEKLDFLAEHLDNLTISLWAATPETYVKTHPNQSKKSFDKIRENILYFTKRKKKTKVVIANVISNLNYSEIEKMVNFAFEAGADQVYFSLIDPIEGETDSLLLNESQQAELKKWFKKVNEKYEKGEYGNLKIDNPDNFLRRISNNALKNGKYDSDIIFNMPCTAGWTFSRIMANGDVAPCCRGVMIPSGNMNNESFKDIWNSRKQQRFRKTGLNIMRYPKFFKKVGCLKSCDNLMQNAQTYELIRKFSDSK